MSLRFRRAVFKALLSQKQSIITSGADYGLIMNLHNISFIGVTTFFKTSGGILPCKHNTPFIIFEDPAYPRIRALLHNYGKSVTGSILFELVRYDVQHHMGNIDFSIFSMVRLLPLQKSAVMRKELKELHKQGICNLQTAVGLHKQ